MRAFLKTASKPFSDFFRRYTYSERVWMLLFFFGCLVRIASVIAYNPVTQIFSDTGRHWDDAKDPLGTSPMALIDSIFYQSWMSLVQRFTLGDPVLVAFYGSIISIACPAAWYLFLRETLRARKPALVGAVLLCWLPSWIGIYSYFMEETVFLPLLGLSLYFTCRARRKGTLNSFLVMVLVWTVTGLTRPMAIPLAATAALMVWLYDNQKVSKAIVSAILLVFILAPLSYRAHKFMGLWSPYGLSDFNKIYACSGKKTVELHLTRGGAFWYYIFQSPSMDYHPLAPFSQWESSRTGTVNIPVDLQAGARDWNRALAQTSVGFPRSLVLRGENVIFLLMDESWPDNNPAQIPARFSVPMRWVWLPLSIFVAGGCIWFRKSLTGHWLLPSLLVVWFIFQGLNLIVVTEGRYRKPAEGMLISLAVVISTVVLRERKTLAQG